MASPSSWGPKRGASASPNTVALPPQSPFLGAPQSTSGQDDGRWPRTSPHPRAHTLPSGRQAGAWSRPMVCTGQSRDGGKRSRGHSAKPGTRSHKKQRGGTSEHGSRGDSRWPPRSLVGSSFPRSRGEQQPCPRASFRPSPGTGLGISEMGLGTAAQRSTHTHLHENKQRPA